MACSRCFEIGNRGAVISRGQGFCLSGIQDTGNVGTPGFGPVAGTISYPPGEERQYDSNTLARVRGDRCIFSELAAFLRTVGKRKLTSV